MASSTWFWTYPTHRCQQAAPDTCVCSTAITLFQGVMILCPTMGERARVLQAMLPTVTMCGVRWGGGGGQGRRTSSNSKTAYTHAGRTHTGDKEASILVSGAKDGPRLHSTSLRLSQGGPPVCCGQVEQGAAEQTDMEAIRDTERETERDPRGLALVSARRSVSTGASWGMCSPRAPGTSKGFRKGRKHSPPNKCLGTSEPQWSTGPRMP